jgi:hypothetical protein
VAWQKSDPEVVAQRASEARIHIVMLLSQAGYDAQDTADMVNDYFDEMVVLTECMGDWPVWVVARAMFERITDTGGDFFEEEE